MGGGSCAFPARDALNCSYLPGIANLSLCHNACICENLWLCNCALSASVARSQQTSSVTGRSRCRRGCSTSQLDQAAGILLQPGRLCWQLTFRQIRKLYLLSLLLQHDCIKESFSTTADTTDNLSLAIRIGWSPQHRTVGETASFPMPWPMLLTYLSLTFGLRWSAQHHAVGETPQHGGTKGAERFNNGHLVKGLCATLCTTTLFPTL